jgi:hypothetical protein
VKSQTLVMAEPDDESASTRVDREPRRIDGEHPTDEVSRDNTLRQDNSEAAQRCVALKAAPSFDHRGDDLSDLRHHNRRSIRVMMSGYCPSFYAVV